MTEEAEEHNYINNFNYSDFKRLIKKYGKTNKQIAKEICHFVDERYIDDNKINKGTMSPGDNEIDGKLKIYSTDVEFYGYNSAYDWVVFCWLFEKMINLPKGFPSYCIDLKYLLDERQKYYIKNKITTIKMTEDVEIIEGLLSSKKHYSIKNLSNYPKNPKVHNALEDAKWNKKLHGFLNII